MLTEIIFVLLMEHVALYITSVFHLEGCTKLLRQTRPLIREDVT
jgi:hypothetical protein